MKKKFTLVVTIATIAITSQAQDTWTKKADFGGSARY
jgi:hypothetical protein